jgi:hypothetical protein
MVPAHQRRSGGIVQDDTQCMTLAGANRGNPVAQRDTIMSACPTYRPMVDGEYHGIALAERHHMRPRLHARPLLGEQEFTAGKILPRPGEQNGHLQREDMLAVQVLMQAVIVAGAVLQQQRRGPGLAGRVAAIDEIPLPGSIDPRAA